VDERTRGRMPARHAGLIGALGLAAAGVACAERPASVRPAAPLAGTYELFVCKGRCPPGDSARAVAVGRLVLQDSAIPLAPVDSRDPVGPGDPREPRPDSADLHLQLGRWRARGTPNGCYVFDRRPERAQTYAGIRRVGVVSWRVRERDSAIKFSLYGSPDAGHDVTLARPDGSGVLRGTGHSSGAGVTAVDWPDDSVVARRVGPPDVEPCFAAAAAEWRRRHGPRSR
jgi:hypothetical protein